MFYKIKLSANSRNLLFQSFTEKLSDTLRKTLCKALPKKFFDASQKSFLKLQTLNSPALLKSFIASRKSFLKPKTLKFQKCLLWKALMNQLFKVLLESFKKLLKIYRIKLSNALQKSFQEKKLFVDFKLN